MYANGTHVDGESAVDQREAHADPGVLLWPEHLPHWWYRLHGQAADREAPEDVPRCGINLPAGTSEEGQGRASTHRGDLR